MFRPTVNLKARSFQSFLARREMILIVPLLGIFLAGLSIACTGEPVIHTVVVEREVEVEKETLVPQTVVVEKEIVVEREVTVEVAVEKEILVPQTVVVEKEVVVEREVTVEVVVEREVTIEREGEDGREKSLDTTQVESIEVDQIPSLLSGVYGEGDIVKDADHAIMCYDAKKNPNYSDLDALTELIESYPDGYLPVGLDQNRMYFSQFNFSQIQYWCNSITQNVEERVLSRSWDLIQHHWYHEGYDAEIISRRWPNVATSSTDFGSHIRGEMVMLDQIPGDPLTMPYELGEFERDVETWATCVKYFDHRTAENLDAATIKVNEFLSHYYLDRFSRIEPSSLYNDAMLIGAWCIPIKNRVERRAIANIVGKPVPIPY